MKRLTIIMVLAVALTGILHDIGRVQESEGVKTRIFYGLNWESNVGFVSGACLDLPLGFKSFPYVRFGLDTGSYNNGIKTDKTVGFEVGYVLKETPQYSLLLLAGAAVDWTAPSAEVHNWTTYLPQSTGVLVSYTLPEKTPLLNFVFTPPFGIVGWVKYRPQLFDSESLWRDKFTAGLAFFGSI